MHSVFAGSMRRLSLWMRNLRRYWHDLACNVMGYCGQASKMPGGSAYIWVFVPGIPVRASSPAQKSKNPGQSRDFET
ncbi:hypothetical protein [Brucella ovis]|uniref:hypothetical protein n=1 Tax=Brucella ovis TaxID=236 RepID=UPI0009B5BA6E|nr:hypothetical protein [Brucella ovis]